VAVDAATEVEVVSHPAGATDPAASVQAVTTPAADVRR